MEELIDECLRVCSGMTTVQFAKTKPAVPATFYVCSLTAKKGEQRVSLDEDKTCIATVADSDNTKYKMLADLQTLADVKDVQMFHTLWLQPLTTKTLPKWTKQLRVLGKTAAAWRVGLDTGVEALPLLKTFVNTRKTAKTTNHDSEEPKKKPKKNETIRCLNKTAI